MPPPLDPRDVYAADRPGALSPAVRSVPARVYVPNSQDNTVDVIDPTTFSVVDHFPVGRLPQHIVASYDLKTLWVTNDLSNSRTPIDPATGKPGTPVAVDDPYNLYFTPDGKYAVVVAEPWAAWTFVMPTPWHWPTLWPCPARGSTTWTFRPTAPISSRAVSSAGKVIKVDVARQEVVGSLELRKGGMPQDVRLSPDGKVFYVADMATGGLFEVDGEALRVVGFLLTGKGTHGLSVSRDSRYLYAANRGEGSVSVVDLARRSVVATWRIPGGGSPDMGRAVHGRCRPVAVRSLQLRGLRLRHIERAPACTPQGRQAAPRLVLLSAARSVFPRPHRGVPLALDSPTSKLLTRPNALRPMPADEVARLSSRLGEWEAPPTGRRPIESLLRCLVE